MKLSSRSKIKPHVNDEYALASSKRQRCVDETGIVIAITAIIIAALVGVVATLAHFSYLSSVQTELQTVADSAALTAAARLNSARTGWADAREAAVKAINELSVLSSVGAEKALVLDINHQEALWDLTDAQNLKVRIERGLWMPPKAEAPARFTSFEGDWQASNPGVPRYAAANAVRVSIERPKTRIFGSPFGGLPEYSVKASSISLRGPPDPVCVAPFAIPVCALLDGSGEFHKDKLCTGDRIFTRADRYCPPETSSPECGEETMPSTPYTAVGGYPLFEEFIHTAVGSSDEIYWSGWYDGMASSVYSLDDYEGLFATNPSTHRRLIMRPNTEPEVPLSHNYHNHIRRSCSFRHDFGWGRQLRFGDSMLGADGPRPYIAKHFGVVGAPGTFPDVDALESYVQSVLARASSDPNACVLASIGDQFQILPDGLTTPEADSAVWNLIHAGQGNSSSSSHVPIVDTLIGSMERHIETAVVQVANADSSPTVDASCATNFRYRGICNSRRGRYELALSPTIQRVSGGIVFDIATYAFRLNNGVTDQTLAWKIKIPVIAEHGEGVSACRRVGTTAGDPGPERDPLISPSGDYRIIGFVESTIYDVDIGNPPPSHQVSKVDESGTEPFPSFLAFQEPCNNVRARINCNTEFIPSSVLTGYAAPRLVAGPPG